MNEGVVQTEVRGRRKGCVCLVCECRIEEDLQGDTESVDLQAFEGGEWIKCSSIAILPVSINSGATELLHSSGPGGATRLIHRWLQLMKTLTVHDLGVVSLAFGRQEASLM